MWCAPSHTCGHGAEGGWQIRRGNAVNGKLDAGAQPTAQQVVAGHEHGMRCKCKNQVSDMPTQHVARMQAVGGLSGARAGAATAGSSL